MRIAIIGDCSLPSPHPSGHGMGLVNAMIAEGLHARGHDVTLFAVHGSRFSGRLVTIEGKGYSDEPRLAKVAYQIHKENPFQVFLDAGHVHILPDMFPDLPVVSVYHDQYQPYARCPILLSEGQRALMPPVFENARIIPNSLPAQTIQPSTVPGEYALFLGAISDLKQPMLAIEACARVGIPLVLAGMTVNNFGLALTQMNNARYIGPVSGAAKWDLIRNARMLLQLSGVESFGLTTLEAMLCGTPVAALAGGGNVDLVEYGVSGMLVQPSRDMVGAVADAMKGASYLDRARVRKSGERFGSVDLMIDRYEDALEDVLYGKVW